MIIYLQGLPESSATEQFASDLINRLPKAGGNSLAAAGLSYRQQERAAADLVKKNQSYGLVLDDEDFAPKAAKPATAGEGDKGKGDKKSLRKRSDKVTCFNNNKISPCYFTPVFCFVFLWFL